MKLTFKWIFLSVLFFSITATFFQNCGQKINSEFNLGSSLAEDSFLNKPIKFDELPAAFSVASKSQQVNGVSAIAAPKQYYVGDVIVDEKFVTSVRNSFQNRNLRNYRGSTKTNATDIKAWPNGVIPIYFDLESGFSSTEMSLVKSNMTEICKRWSAVAKIECREVSDKTIRPLVLITQSQVALAWANNQKLCNSPTAISCASIGYSDVHPLRYLAIHKQLISDLRNSMHEFGHVIGLNHEHQRPGRENYLQFRFNYDPTQVSVSDYDILYNLPAVNNDYDFGSLMHYLVTGQRNAAFVAGNTTAAILAYKTSALFEANYPLNRAARNSYSSGSAGAAVNISGYPSAQDVQNVVDLYGPPSISKRSCVLFGGQVVLPHGAIIGVYTNQVQTANNQYCNDEPRLCDDGNLVGGDKSEGYRSCPLRCTIADQQVAYGDSVTYYEIQNGTQAECDARKKTVYCEFPNMGASKATPGFITCTPRAAQGCSFNGQSVANGQSVLAYQAATVPFGSSCASQTRTCANGTLSGTYGFSACTAGSAQGCSFNGQSVANGQSVVAYQVATVPFGGNCVSQTRVCTNGSLSGSYGFSACTVGSAQGCVFNGQSVANGQSVIAYQAATVPFGSSCVSQTRVCTNGSLSGSYGFSACTVQAQAQGESTANIPNGQYTYTLGQSFTFKWQAATGYISMGQRNKVYSATNTLIANNSQIVDWNSASGTSTASTNELEPLFQGTNTIRIEYELMQKSSSGVWSTTGKYLSLTFIKNNPPAEVASCAVTAPTNSGIYSWDINAKLSTEVINWKITSNSIVSTSITNTQTGEQTDQPFAAEGLKNITLKAGSYNLKFFTKNSAGQKIPCNPESADIEVLDAVGSVKGNIDQVTEQSDGSVTINGWTCVYKYAQSIDAHLYVGNSAGQAGATMLSGVKANIFNEPGVNSACGTTGVTHRFVFTVSKSQVQQHAGKKVYVHGIHPDPAGMRNIAIDSSGEKYLPFSADTKSCEMVRVYTSGNIRTELPTPINTKLTYLYGVSIPHSEDHNRIVWCSPGMTQTEMAQKTRELEQSTGGLWGHWQAFESQGYGMNEAWGAIMCGGWVFESGKLKNNGKTENLVCSPQTYQGGS